jgi:hypothetical protein
MIRDAVKPVISQELAGITKISEHNIREWSANQVADGYVTYDASPEIFSSSQ